MRVLRGLVDVSICRGFCESTTRILYPTSIKFPRPNIFHFDDNWSIYRGLAASHTVHGVCHFLRCGPHPGSAFKNRKRPGRGAGAGIRTTKKSYTTEQTFPTIEPNFQHYVRQADQESGKIFRAEALENETGIAGRTYRRTMIINRVQMRIGMMM